jgi:hypothetical protein
MQIPLRYVRNYPFLRHLPTVLDKDGAVRTPEKGIYSLGMRFEMTRSSSFIDGVGPDADVIANHISIHSREEKWNGNDKLTQTLQVIIIAIYIYGVT